MVILCLGPQREGINNFLRSCGEHPLVLERKLDGTESLLEEADFIISFGYRYILSESLLSRFPDRVINIHISLLPWNRGADPNLWSFLENTPKGVTIHKMSRGLDEGEILVQEEVTFSNNETLRSTYYQLCDLAARLLFKHWIDLRKGRIISQPQRGKGSFHKAKDKEKYLHLLRYGWDTPIKDLIGRAV